MREASRHFRARSAFARAEEEEDVQGILEHLTDLGQLAVILAEFTFVLVVWVALLWRPRHRTHRRPHDCRAYGCNWLDDRPTR